jgi:hypothetical protein
MKLSAKTPAISNPRYGVIPEQGFSSLPLILSKTTDEPLF